MTIDDEFDLGRIGVDFHLGHRLGPVDRTAGCDVDHRLGIPVGLVKVKGVFFDFGVVGPTLKLPF